jgi:hypothetical protein
MPAEILIHLAVEDELSEHLLRASLAQTGRPFLVGAVYGRRGNEYLKRMLRAFKNAARGSAHLVMTDLDKRPCVPELIEDWFRCEIAEYSMRRHPNLLFRVAVHEAESWVMADREAFARYLGIAVHHVPCEPDAVRDPKKKLLDLARLSRRRDLRDDLVPRPGDKRAVGPDYNGRLAEFLHSSWRANRAEARSPSFRRTFSKLKAFHPILGTPSSQKAG